MPERQLSWQPAFSLSRKPVKRAGPRRKNRQNQFEIIIEQPQNNSSLTKCFTSAPVIRQRHSVFGNSSRGHSVVGNPQRVGSQRVENEPLLGLSPGVLPEESLNSARLSLDLEPSDETAGSRPSSLTTGSHYSTSALSPESTAGGHLIACPGSHATAPTVLANTSSPSFTAILSTVEYGSLTERFRPILTRCMRSL
jgi:hypothetical protein